MTFLSATSLFLYSTSTLHLDMSLQSLSNHSLRRFISLMRGFPTISFSLPHHLITHVCVCRHHDVNGSNRRMFSDIRIRMTTGGRERQHKCLCISSPGRKRQSRSIQESVQRERERIFLSPRVHFMGCHERDTSRLAASRNRLMYQSSAMRDKSSSL